MTKKEYAAKALAMINSRLFGEEVNLENVAAELDYGDKETCELIFAVAHKLSEAQNMLDDITYSLKK